MLWLRVISGCVLIAYAGDVYGRPQSGMYTPSKNIYEAHHERFWNIDPYRLESVVSYFLLYQDPLSRGRLSQLFPKLTVQELQTLSKSLVHAKSEGFVCSEEERQILKKISLEGLRFFSIEQVEVASPEHDLASSLVMAEFPEKGRAKATHYAYVLDLLALRIYVERLRYMDRYRYPLNSEDFHKCTIEAINTILFFEDGIRYPSKREMLSDEFSFLSSVTDKKFGVCLGVSSLYYALSQRLMLPLDAITLPGHIYLSYQQGKVNIETTAGGRHIATKQYEEGVSKDTFRVRPPREIIALTFMNQGSFALQKQEYQRADEAYERAVAYFEDKQELQELRGVVKILKGDKKGGEALLKDSSQAQVVGSPAYDYLHGNMDDQMLALLFMSPGDSYQEITEYYQGLKQASIKSKKCCECWRRLASTALHLGKTAECVQYLEKCIQDTPDDVFLYLKLCKILCDRYDFAKSASYFSKVHPHIATHKDREQIINSFLYRELIRILSIIDR